jgi:hypothetical protein
VDKNSSFDFLLAFALTEQMQRNAKPFSPWCCNYSDKEYNEDEEWEDQGETDEIMCEQMA